MSRALTVLLAWLLGSAMLLGCRPMGSRHPFDPADPEATAARLEAWLARHPKDCEAWRDLAHVRWLHQGQTAKAVEILDRLATDGDPLARLSRLVIAEARLDAATVVEQAQALLVAATKAKADDPNRPLLEATAELAARSLGRVHGDQKGDDRRFETFYDRLDIDALPFSAQQPLVSLRGAIARRRDEDYRPLYAREGCVQTWQASAVLGMLGAYELGRRLGDPFAVDPEAEVVPLSCAVRVWNPTPRAGIRRLQTFLEVTGEVLQLDLSAEEAMRARLDGTLLYRTDLTDRFPASRRRVRVKVKPGVHRLEIATTISGENAWVLVRAVDAAGHPVKTSARAPKGGSAPKVDPAPTLRRPPWPDPIDPLASPIYAPLRRWLALDAALADGDSDRAESLAWQLRTAKRFGEGKLGIARFEREDPSRGRTVSAAREQTALEAALAIDPRMDAARLRLLEIQLGRGEDAEVVEALGGLPKGSLHQIQGELLRFRAHRARGDELQALEALGRAERLDAKNCRVLIARRAIAQERDDVRGEDELAAAMEDCGGSSSLRARLAETRGEHEEAEALWKEILNRVPDDIEAIEGLARVAAATGDSAGAEARLRRVLALNPQRVGAYIGLADLAAASGEVEAGRRELRDALDKLPFSNALHEAAETLGIEDDLWRFRVDGRRPWPRIGPRGPTTRACPKCWCSTDRWPGCTRTAGSGKSCIWSCTC